MNIVLKEWLETHASEIFEIAKIIWENPEPSLEEYFACETTAEFLRKHGFEVFTYNCIDSSKPHNTVVATWGEQEPVIGIIGEYDALPDLGQEAVPYHSPINGLGHGCGHNLMAASGVAAAIALREAMIAEHLNGSVKFFGCPAEETTEGKMHMIRDGLFDGLDCCIAWHPEARNLRIRENVQNSLTQLIVEFFGKTAHAASAPEKGRSALDACEIMNMGVNYLREHMESTSRIHYSYLSAGEKPNVVPKYASVYYYVRARDLKANKELVERVRKCAAGAATMTETSHKVTVKLMVSGCIQIPSFNQFFYESILKAPPLVYSPEEKEFAHDLYRNIQGESNHSEDLIPVGIDPPTHIHENSPGSTDAGYLTHLVPTSRIHGWGMVTGTPMHSWGVVSAVGSSIGLKAALHAAMVQAQCGYDILKNPSVIEIWKKELADQLNKLSDIKPIFPERL